jgi:nucleoside-diphosphate-sugar epimerase
LNAIALATGWRINALKRNLESVNTQSDIHWFKGDALNLDDVKKAAQGCSVIIHAVNPPGYKNWGQLVLPMLNNTLQAAKEISACVVLPGTVYNFGPDVFPVISENSAQNPITRKGRIRVDMEEKLRNFANEGGQVIIVRAGDFFGPSAINNWFSQGLVKPKMPVSTISNPSTTHVGHQWAYLPDVATTMVKLIQQREQLDAFAVFHMQGFWDEDGTQMAKAISRVVKIQSDSTPRILAFPWWLMHLVAPFNETVKEMIEMKYLWKKSLKMTNTKLTQQLGKEPNTPIEQAVEATLKGLGCLD